MIKLSIVIPVYNTEKYLSRCISSCVQQIRDGVEIIIINDGSPDNSQTIIDDYCSRYSCIRCIRQSNQGLSFARNHGLEASKGEYVWFVDSDDSIDVKGIDYIYKAIETNPDVVSIRRFNESDCKVDVDNYNYCTGKDILLDKVFEHGAVFYIYKRCFLDSFSLRFKDGIYHEDTELIPRILYYAARVVKINTPLYYVTINPTSITRTVNPKKAYDLVEVAKSLYAFREDMIKETDIKKVFDRLISVVLNNSLANMSLASIEHRRLFDKSLLKANMESHIFSSLRRSGLKYKVESVLFRLFPRNCTGVYLFMKKFDWR